MKKRGALFIGTGVFLILLIAAAVLVPRFKRHVLAVNCANYMISINYAARIWSEDHNGQLPSDFRCMSNELGTPRILICPADSSRHSIADWSSLSPSNSTYEILTPGSSSSKTNGPFFRCPIHGYVAYPDGSVFDGARLLKKW